MDPGEGNSQDGGRDVSEITDVDELWKALLAAKHAGDAGLQRAIEARMRELRDERRFAHLTDEELDAQIAAMAAQREPKDTIRHSPGGGSGAGAAWGGGDVVKLNAKIIANQHVGIEATRAALLDERARRRDAGSDEGPQA